jgi:hypothetical protein
MSLLRGIFVTAESAGVLASLCGSPMIRTDMSGHSHAHLVCRSQTILSNTGEDRLPDRSLTVGVSAWVSSLTKVLEIGDTSSNGVVLLARIQFPLVVLRDLVGLHSNILVRIRIRIVLIFQRLSHW